MLVSAGLLIAAHVSAVQKVQRPAPFASLFIAFLWGGEIAPSATEHLEPLVREAVAARLAERRAYKPILTVPPGLQRLEESIAWKAQQFEGMLATLSGLAGAASEAAALAGELKLAYEWEGDSAGPISEATRAEKYLGAHPKTPLAPALNLFILHRYRCGFEAAVWNKEASARAISTKGYRAAWTRISQSHDPVVLVLAQDIDESPYVYIDIRLHPRRR